MDLDMIKFLNSDVWFDFKDFYTYVATKNYKNFVEVGVYKGHSIVFLAQQILRNWNGQKIYAIDHWDNKYIEKFIDCKFDLYEAYNYNLNINNCRNIIQDIRANSIDAAKCFAEKSLDFVFIDADHNFDSVYADINAWLPKICDGGTISGHDYGEESCDVKKVVDQIFCNKVKVMNKVWYVDIADI